MASLVDLEMATTPHGQMALAIARRLDSPRETGSAIAALSKQLATLLDVVDQRGKRAADPLDELRERRRVKASA